MRRDLSWNQELLGLKESVEGARAALEAELQATQSAVIIKQERSVTAVSEELLSSLLQLVEAEKAKSREVSLRRRDLEVRAAGYRRLLSGDMLTPILPQDDLREELWAFSQHMEPAEVFTFLKYAGVVFAFRAGRPVGDVLRARSCPLLLSFAGMVPKCGRCFVVPGPRWLCAHCLLRARSHSCCQSCRARAPCRCHTWT